MFSDIHTHILNEVDDGCSSIEESIFLLKQAELNEVENVILTPHFDPENPDTLLKKEIMKKILNLKAKIKGTNLKINIYPGSEVRITPSLAEKLKDKNFIDRYPVTLMDCNRYILIEAPFLKMPPDFEDMVFKIRLSGLTPILAHPERNSEVRENIKILSMPRHEGLLIQVNTSSLVDKKESLSYKTAVELIKKDMVDFIASDCHYMKGRYSNFLEAFRLLNKIAGKQKAERIAIKNPGSVLNNEDILS